MRLADYKGYDSITIQCHDNPDADTLASGFALKKYLLSKETREALKGTPKPTIKSNADGTLSVKEPQTILEKTLHHAKKLKYPFDEF